MRRNDHGLPGIPASTENGPPSTLSELHPDKAPEDKHHIVYITCILIGTASLMPFNILIASADYISHHFGDDDELGKLLPFANIANLLAIVFMIFVGRKTSFWLRLVVIQSFVAFTVFAMPFVYHVLYPDPLSMSDTKNLTYIITCILGGSGGMFTSTVTAYGALLMNPKYIQVVVACMTLSAIIPDSVRLLCKLAFSKTWAYSGFHYFFICGSVVLAASIMFLIGNFTPHSRYFIDGYNEREKVRRAKKAHFLQSIKNKYLKPFESTINSSRESHENLLRGLHDQHQHLLNNNNNHHADDDDDEFDSSPPSGNGNGGDRTGPAGHSKANDMFFYGFTSNDVTRSITATNASMPRNKLTDGYLPFHHASTASGMGGGGADGGAGGGGTANNSMKPQLTASMKNKWDKDNGGKAKEPPMLNRSQSRFSSRGINIKNEIKAGLKIKEYLDATTVSIPKVFIKIWPCLLALGLDFGVSFLVYPTMFLGFKSTYIDDSDYISILILVFNIGDFIGRQILASMTFWTEKLKMGPNNMWIYSVLRIAFVPLFMCFNNGILNNDIIVYAADLLMGMTQGLIGTLLFCCYAPLLLEKEQEAGAAFMQLLLVVGLLVGSLIVPYLSDITF